jgi:hypothetical protein
VKKIVSVIVRMRASFRNFRDNGQISVTKDFGGMSVQQKLQMGAMGALLDGELTSVVSDSQTCDGDRTGVVSSLFTPKSLKQLAAPTKKLVHLIR